MTEPQWRQGEIDALRASLATEERRRAEDLVEYGRRFAAAERDRDELAEALWQDESRQFHALLAIKARLRLGDWILESRGPYEWDDDRYKDEAGAVFRDIEAIIAPVEKATRSRMRVGEKRFDGIGAPLRAMEARALAAEAALAEQVECGVEQMRAATLATERAEAAEAANAALRRVAEAASVVLEHFAPEHLDRVSGTSCGSYLAATLATLPRDCPERCRQINDPDSDYRGCSCEGACLACHAALPKEEQHG